MRCFWQPQDDRRALSADVTSWANALEALASVPVLCLDPKATGESGCSIRPRPAFERVELPGGHHFGGDYDSVASCVASFVSANSPR